ncbi:hypothetical protein KBC31_00975 [Candidatus Saccharibacteria bacterium]|nr:hypothetical protein [Candidatus Saccharibacteria bacterium]
MFNELYLSWKKKNDFKKVQAVYGAFVLLGLVVAGLVSLLNQHVGETLVEVVKYAAIITIVNTLVWAVVNSSEDNTPTAKK